MSTISVQGLEFLTSLQLQNYGSRNCHRRFQRNAASWPMALHFLGLKLSPSHDKKREALGPSDHESDPSQPPEEDPIQEDNTSNESEQFVAREASLDQEYYKAAWLRAEIHFEDYTDMRHLASFKYQFAEQEFNAIKRRSKLHMRYRSICIIMVPKEEKNVKCNPLESVVGTVDVYIRNFVHGKTFPQDPLEAHIFSGADKRDSKSITFAYLANLCVAKSARRRGIGGSMLRFAFECSKANGAGRVYVHVDRSNKAAQGLYHQLGFQMMEEANLELVKSNISLLCLELEA